MDFSDPPFVMGGPSPYTLPCHAPAPKSPHALGHTPTLSHVPPAWDSIEVLNTLLALRIQDVLLQAVLLLHPSSPE